MRAFLGANSERGFVSLYGGFPGENARLHIIKGGPGCGKSGFMRKLADEAQTRGERVMTVLCSGDPDSLDGVWLMDRAEAWVDGTAPHAIEPGAFGIDSDYVNLGCFFGNGMTQGDCLRGKELYRAYREKYREAYELLSGAGKLHRWPESLEKTDISHGEGELLKLLELPPNEKKRCQGRETGLFLSAISCQGMISLKEEASELCKLIIHVSGALALRSALLKNAADELMARGLDVTVGYDPLCPDCIEAVLSPVAGVAVLAAEEGRIALPRGDRETVERLGGYERGLLEMATVKLSEAKRLHDELEGIYRGYMDFRALDVYTEQEMRRVFQNINNL